MRSPTRWCRREADRPPRPHPRGRGLLGAGGELEVSVGGDGFRAGAGSFVHLPRGVIHSYRNVGTGPARFLTLMVPAGLEKFFEEVGKPGTDVSSPPPVGEEDIDKLLALAPKYGVEIPPPGP
ncbi:MAG TPA: cupin domain-containing protein [Rubrobacter sp.]|nr:cupin domain-containing protein [Rubrobacter sp.]